MKLLGFIVKLSVALLISVALISIGHIVTIIIGSLIMFLAFVLPIFTFM